jgi:hypothetical protein
MQTKLEALHEKLVEGLNELVSGENWKAMMNFSAKFHRYSASNILLIQIQRPDATQVAGYTTWTRTLGRQVNKGAKGIAILAPCAYKAKGSTDTPIEEESTRTPVERKVLRSFKVAHVFDVSDTTGPDLPEVRPNLLEGDAPSGLWSALEQQIREKGFDVIRTDCSPANGRTSFLARIVQVRPDLSPAAAVKTLAHELGHVLLHDGSYDDNRCRQEVEAESVAHLVCAVAGLDSDQYTYPYVASWADGDIEVVRKTADVVRSTANAILERISAQAPVTAEA